MIDPKLLRVLEVGHPHLHSRLVRAVQLYEALQKSGWTTEEIMLAQATGYYVESHAFGGWSNAKYRRNAEWMYDWLRHHYRHLKGADTGITFAQFVDIWVKLSGRLRYSLEHHSLTRRLLAEYMRARRSGLDDSEIMTLFEAHAYSENQVGIISLYIELRTRLSRNLVDELLRSFVAAGISVGSAMRREILKLYKAGFSSEEIVTRYQRR